MKIAVIKTGGKQYKIKEGDIIKIETVKGKRGENIEFDKVLMISGSDAKGLKIGNPTIKDAKVSAKVIEQGRARKVRVVKYKPKTRYHKVQGHRQKYTKIKIEKISV